MITFEQVKVEIDNLWAEGPEYSNRDRLYWKFFDRMLISVLVDLQEGGDPMMAEAMLIAYRFFYEKKGLEKESSIKSLIDSYKQITAIALEKRGTDDPT